MQPNRTHYSVLIATLNQLSDRYLFIFCLTGSVSGDQLSCTWIYCCTTPYHKILCKKKKKNEKKTCVFQIKCSWVIMGHHRLPTVHKTCEKTLWTDFLNMVWESGRTAKMYHHQGIEVKICAATGGETKFASQCSDRGWSHGKHQQSLYMIHSPQPVSISKGISIHV